LVLIDRRYTEKTTSDLLPSSTPVDLTLSLELADFIRSGSVQPPQSCKSLLKRLQHSNPNVQLLSLQVLDVCIKNGGTPFLLQISDKDKDFYNGLELLAKGDSKFGGNRDVKEKTLEKLQEWAVAFKGKESLGETQLVKVYERLKNQGEPFPKIDSNASAAMVDSLSAPEWQDSSYCTRCRTDFSTFNRKHHCRNCGQVFDASCSSQTSPLPHYGITQQVRVCDGCHKKIKEGKGSQVARNQSVKSNGSSSTTTTKKKSSSSSSSRRDQEEEDLKKAIEASLKESSHSHGPLRNDVPPTKSSGYNPSYASTTTTTTNGGGRGGGDQEDEDLAAAIAASLRDVAPPPTAPSFNRQDSSSQQAVTYSEMFPRRPSYDSYSSTTTNYDTSSSTPRPRINLPSYDLSPSQLSSLSQFTSTFSQQQHPGPSYYLTNQEHELANSTVRDLQPRLERSLEDTKRRIEILKELEWKLSQAARLYGAGLTELNNNHRQGEF
jgi:growth factor-regulated tyrosine kinase substrate